MSRGRQAAAAFDAAIEDWVGAHAPGKLGLGQARPGAQHVDQLPQLAREGGRGVGPGAAPSEWQVELVVFMRPFRVSRDAAAASPDQRATLSVLPGSKSIDSPPSTWRTWPVM